MAGNDSFKPWVDAVYLGRFPSPPRNRNFDWSAENLFKKGFYIDTPPEFENEIMFDKQQLINYLTTQSNIEAAVMNGGMDYEAVEKWLAVELKPFFEPAGTAQRFYFSNRIRYLKKFEANG